MNAHASEPARTPASRIVSIELLALDLTTCSRCLGTLEYIEQAIDAVRPVLEAMGVQVKVTGSKAGTRPPESESCCCSAEQATCCAPEEKHRCCGPVGPATCGCG